MIPARGPHLLFLPAAAIFLALFVLPMAGLFVESFRLFEPGRIGSAIDAPFTAVNYSELLTPSFAGFFFQTLRISLLASLAGMFFSLPLAYWIARRLSAHWRAIAVGFFVTLMFLSVLVRTYALELTFGAAGPMRSTLLALGISPNGRGYIEILVGAGLLHYIIPMSTLTLLGTIQNVDPRLTDAAQALGAPAWRAHLTVTLPLCMRGILAAFLFAFTFSISAFVIPMILGKGRVLFISNLIYNRFSEIANYPSGAAISIVLFVLAMLIVYVMTHQVNKRWQS
ncbi:ABC transporter permease [Nordella sp. HKS 07]|uniref:ABC transporter permease n=1 Tax=Nordella sp. HKS 07 TaxID=2712222 RepID=UPI0013E1715F|nr:ABC transporter permease [Nordella sp. HKS 07]QIG47439.1 ABC transporter permease [Nordella sp. HKS 07]